MSRISPPASFVLLLVLTLRPSPLFAFVDDRAEQPGVDSYGDPLPSGVIARIGTIRFRHASLWRVAFSPDGKTIASGGRDNEVRLWDPESGRAVRRFQGHTESINCLAFSGDGKQLASGSWEGRFRNSDKGEIRLWEVAS